MEFAKWRAANLSELKKLPGVEPEQVVILLLLQLLEGVKNLNQDIKTLGEEMGGLVAILEEDDEELPFE